MKIDVRSNIKEVTRQMRKVVKEQVPKAVSIAIDQVAMAARRDMEEHILQEVDNPVAFTKKATFFSGSSKNRLPVTATVGIKDKQAEYLNYVEHGGTSAAKGTAKPVPTSKMKNKFGNIPRGKISRILKKRSKYFSGVPKGSDRPAGVYQRMGSKKNPKLRMLASWKKSTHHSPRMRLAEIVQRRVNRDMNKQLRKTFAKYVSN